MKLGVKMEVKWNRLELIRSRPTSTDSSPAVQHQQIAGVAYVGRVEAVVVEVVEEPGGDEAVRLAIRLQRLRRPLQLVQVGERLCNRRSVGSYLV